MREDIERHDDIVDLGAATEVTQGIYDPVKKENLVAAMFTGVKKLDASTEVPAVRFVSSWRALGLFALALVAVILIVKRPF